MTWKYYRLKFPSKSVADSVYIASSESFTWNPIMQKNMGADYYVDIAVLDDIPASLETYRIPFEFNSGHAFFVSNEGVM